MTASHSNVSIRNKPLHVVFVTSLKSYLHLTSMATAKASPMEVFHQLAFMIVNDDNNIRVTILLLSDKYTHFIVHLAQYVQRP
jgi:hypothetical protein